MPYTLDFTFANGNWENDNVNVIKVSFKDNGDGTCNIYLIPLKGDIAANSYIYGRVTYICKN